MKRAVKNLFCGAAASAAILASATPYNVYAMTQDETVYAKLQTSGEVNYVSVTKHLINDDKSETMKDLSSLTKIENLNGFETDRHCIHSF